MTSASTEYGLLAAIHDNPSDDNIRLVWADWLGETGGEVKCPRLGGKCDGKIWSTSRAAWEECDECPQCDGTGRTPDAVTARGEFIRLQIQIAEIRRTCGCGGCVRLRGGGQHHNGPCGIDRTRDEDGNRIPPRRQRESTLLTTHHATWFPGLNVFWDHSGFLAHDPTQSGPAGYVRRGMLEGVRCTVGQLVGEVCPHCDGQGKVEVWDWDSRYSPCVHCGGEWEKDDLTRVLVEGDGRLDPIAPVVGREPAEITIIDREPVIGMIYGAMYCYWYVQGQGEPGLDRAYVLPKCLFDLLPEEGKRIIAEGTSNIVASYNGNRMVGLDKLKVAAKRYCRQEWEKSCYVPTVG